MKDHPDAWKFWAQGPYNSAEEFSQDFVENVMHKDRSKVLFVVLDKTGLLLN
jgi:hypothetical protein